MERTPSERVLQARVAAHHKWATTTDRSAATEPARRALLERFELQVDPDGLLTPAERSIRAEHARKAYFTGLALKSARARRKGRELLAEADGADAELSGDAA